MFIEVVKSKLHKVTVTDANLQYVGSITIDDIGIESLTIVNVHDLNFFVFDHVSCL